MINLFTHPIALSAVPLSLLALAATACDANPSGETLPRNMPEVLRDPFPDSDMPLGHPDLASLAILSRGPRRMSVEQLEQSIEQIGQLAPGTVVFPDGLALTLGRPDYLRVTDETLDPSPLFMKFMLDLAGIACTNLSDADPTRPIEDRVLTRFSDVDQNLEYLLLRFTGIEGEAKAPYIERLKRVREAGAESARGATGGWEAVCIALFTSPEFLVY